MRYKNQISIVLFLCVSFSTIVAQEVLQEILGVSDVEVLEGNIRPKWYKGKIKGLRIQNGKVECKVYYSRYPNGRWTKINLLRIVHNKTTIAKTKILLQKMEGHFFQAKDASLDVAERLSAVQKMEEMLSTYTIVFPAHVNAIWKHRIQHLKKLLKKAKDRQLLQQVATTLEQANDPTTELEQRRAHFKKPLERSLAQVNLPSWEVKPLQDRLAQVKNTIDKDSVLAKIENDLQKAHKQTDTSFLYYAKDNINKLREKYPLDPKLQTLYKKYLETKKQIVVEDIESKKSKSSKETAKKIASLKEKIESLRTDNKYVKYVTSYDLSAIESLDEEDTSWGLSWLLMWHSNIFYSIFGEILTHTPLAFTVDIGGVVVLTPGEHWIVAGNFESWDVRREGDKLNIYAIKGDIKHWNIYLNHKPTYAEDDTEEIRKLKAEYLQALTPLHNIENAYKVLEDTLKGSALWSFFIGTISSLIIMAFLFIGYWLLKGVAIPFLFS